MLVLLQKSGLDRAMSQIGHVRLALAAGAVGSAMWVLDYLREQLNAPHRSGSPLASKESVQLRHADMQISVFAARSMLYRVARMVTASGVDENKAEVAAVKIFATETAGRVVDEAIQLVGGNALIVGHPLEALYRKVRSMRLTEGANDLLRMQLSQHATGARQPPARL